MRATADNWPILVGGSWETSSETLEIRRPGDDSLVGVTSSASADQLETAVKRAIESRTALASMAGYERSEILRTIATNILANKDRIAELLCAEAGKPLRDAVTEVERTSLTFRMAAEEAERAGGELIPLDRNVASKGRFGITKRFPVGLVAGISPFNLPLSLAAHKLAPAMAVGCPIVLKISSVTPLAMLEVAKIIEAAGAPAGSVSIMPMEIEVGDKLVTDDRFKLLSFTGSPAVGWAMKARAGKKKVVLELGGNAGALVDCSADLEWAATRCAAGAFKYAGQTCISVQRIFVHTDVYSEFVERFVARAAALSVGDPADAASDIGPVIDSRAATRIKSWVSEAVAAGADCLIGGDGDGTYVQPTVLVNVPESSRVCTDEVFGPVAVVSRVESFAAGLAAINDSAFGLQAGVFTSDLMHSWQAFDALEVGGVIINDSPSYRIDHMPYGGVKDSGLGREGIRYAMDDMTELRLMVMTSPI